MSLYLSSIASFVRFGGSGGKVAGSNTGALILPPSIDAIRAPGPLTSPFDRVEMVEMVEEMDSFECFLSNCCSEGRRGGKAGEGWVESLLAGSLGGGTGFEDCSTFCPVRTMFVGGGRTPFLFGRLGSFPIPPLLS